MKKLLIALLVAAGITLAAGTALAAPLSIIQKTILPETNEAYELGTSTPSMRQWLRVFTETLCLDGDCRSTWPTGGFLTNSGANTYLNTGTHLQAPTFEATSTTATSTFPRLNVSTAISITGTYITNFANYVRQVMGLQHQSVYRNSVVTASTSPQYTLDNFRQNTPRWANTGSGSYAFSDGVLTVTTPASADVIMIRTLWSAILAGYDYVEFDVNFNGNTLLTAGDTPTLGFDQSGGKGILLTNYATNGTSGWQHVRVPLSKFTANYDSTPSAAGTGTALDPSVTVTNIRLRIYENSAGQTFSIRNMVLSDSTNTLREDFTQPDLFNQDKDGNGLWKIRSLDVMKVSKDNVASQYTSTQMSALIVALQPLNPTHIAQSVPYDDPAGFPGGPYTTAYAQRWSDAIHNAGFAVWHRQTWNAFEGIYSVTKSNAAGPGTAAGVLNGTDTTSFLYQVYNYILTHPDQYAPGDIFTPLPEPDNGGINGVTTCFDSVCQFTTANEFRIWLRDAITVSNAAFEKLGLKGKIHVGYYGISGFTVFGNGGNPHGFLDDRTADAMTVITMDDYPSPASDVSTSITRYEGIYGNFPLVIGEWGTLNETSTSTKAAAVDSVVGSYAAKTYVQGMNYWTSIGGTNENLVDTTTLYPQGGVYDRLRYWYNSGRPFKIANYFATLDPHNPLYIGSSTPSYGSVLVASSPTYASWQATSTLGLSSGAGTVTSIATTYPITGGTITTTGTLALAFGTTTANAWGAHNTFTSLNAALASTTNATTTGSAYFTALAAGGAAIDANGKLYTGATSTLSTISGTLALAQLAAQAANTVVVNQTSGSAAPTALATSTFANGLYSGTAGQVLYRTSAGTWIGTATTTFSTGLTYTNGAVTVNTSQNIATLSNLTSNGAILTSGGAGTLGIYAGTSCTNQFVRSLSGAIAATCATVGAADVSLANLTATDSTLTFSGTYTGATARTIGLNLTNQNNWTGRQNFTNASSTLFSATYAQIGGTATTTFLTNGNVGIGTSSPFTSLGVTGVITANSINATSTTQTSTFSGILAVLTRLITVISATFTPTTEGEIGIDSSGPTQLKYFAGGAVRTLTPARFASWSYATSTAWTGTTTRQLGPAGMNETWGDVKCFTDTGTVQVSVYDGTNRMNWINASTTVGTTTLSSNNAFVQSEKRYVDLGTPASSPTQVSCTATITTDPI